MELWLAEQDCDTEPYELSGGPGGLFLLLPGSADGAAAERLTPMRRTVLKRENFIVSGDWKLSVDNCLFWVLLDCFKL